MRAALFVVLASAASAGSVTYSFESPNFTAGQTTPLLNEAPNSGNIGGFFTNFTAVGGGSDYGIFAFAPNSLFNGQSLVASTSTNGLVLTFNDPVTAISFDFAVDDSTSGNLSMFIPSIGSFSFLGTQQSGGGFVGNLISFSSLTPFFSVTLTGTNSGGNPTQLALDNLTLTTPVPEPSAFIAISGIALAVMARRYARQ